MSLLLHRFSPEEQAQNLALTLDQFPPSRKEGIWLFVYGLLAMDPPFTYTESKIAMLNDYQRRFNLADPVNRGTPEQPGRALGLAAGGQTTGIAYLLQSEHVEEGLQHVWEQEMAVPFYTPSWLTIEGQKMLVMMMDPASPALVEEPVSEAAGIIKTSQGSAGTNREYLQAVRSAFKAYGVVDEYLEAVNAALSK